MTIATCKFSELEKVCKKLGLVNKKGSYVWKGYANNGFRRVSIHKHGKARDIATGTFNQYVKDLGFNSHDEFFDFLNNK